MTTLLFWFPGCFQQALTATRGLKCSGTACKCSEEVKSNEIGSTFPQRFKLAWRDGVMGWMVSTKQPRQVPLVPGY